MTQLGQHFLTLQTALRTIATAVPVPKDAVIVEVGPGKGALTTHLLAHPNKVVAFEKSVRLYTVLLSKFEDEVGKEHLSIYNHDIRDMSWLQKITDPYIIIANIPFYLTGSFIRTVLTEKQQPTALALVVQKEIAERISRNKSPKESLISLSVQLFGTPKYQMTIKRSAFKPRPLVDAALLCITDVTPQPKALQDAYFQIIRTAFHEKRKGVLKKFSNNETLHQLLIENEVTNKTRAEDVPFSTWLTVAKKVSGVC